MNSTVVLLHWEIDLINSVAGSEPHKGCMLAYLGCILRYTVYRTNIQESEAGKTLNTGLIIKIEILTTD